MSAQSLAIPAPGAKSRLDRAVMITVIVVPFLLTLYAIVRLWLHLVFPSDLVIFAFMYVITGLGITVGYHRLLTHQSFEAQPIVRFLLLACGSMAAEGGAVTWASTHLKHHAYSDKEGDPHSPLDGFVHAHMGWMIDGWFADPEKHGPWMLKDRMAMFFERTFIFWMILAYIIPFVLGYFLSGRGMAGAWSALLWGGAVRMFFTHHVTWSVNSVCHTFGRRRFETKDESRNQWLVGLLAFGEGWHNNHHAFPRSADHGLSWNEVDLSAYLIRGLEAVGLAKNVVRIPLDQQLEREATDRRRRAAAAGLVQTPSAE